MNNKELDDEKRLIKNKIANALHYYRNTKEPNLEEMVDDLFCLIQCVMDKTRSLCFKYERDRIREEVERIRWFCGKKRNLLDITEIREILK